MRKRILVLGRNGQLATSVRIHPAASEYEIICSGRAECDMRNFEKFSIYLKEIAPDAIINTAAYTDVERAESELWDAFNLNAIAVQYVSEFCANTNTPLIHISTDYVYDGNKATPYNETDKMNPISAYGCSKAVGDNFVIKNGGTVLRTAWLFSGHNRNFARTMISLAEKHDIVRVVDDQYGNPTCADDLAEVALRLAGKLLSGEKLPSVILVGAMPFASWADLAEEVFRNLEACGQKRPQLVRILAKDFPTKANRPYNSRFDTALLQKLLPDVSLRWKERVADAVKTHIANKDS